jgi:hypothetical protein
MSTRFGTPKEPIHNVGLSRETKTTNSDHLSSGKLRRISTRDKLMKHRLNGGSVRLSKTLPERETTHITASNSSGPLRPEAKRTLRQICAAFHARNKFNASPSSIMLYLLWADADGVDFAGKAAKGVNLPFQPSPQEFHAVLAELGLSYK